MSLLAFLGVKEIILLVMVFVAILVAIVLTFIEVRMSKLLREGKPTIEEILINKLRIYLKSEKALKDKLDYLNLLAKWYFKRAFGFESELSYSQLTNKFKEIKKNNFADFCREMFEVFYAKRDVKEKEIFMLYDKFIKSLEKMKPREMTEENPILDKFDRFLLMARKKYLNFKINLLSRLKGLGKAGKMGEEISDNLKTRIVKINKRDVKKDVEKLKKILKREREKRAKLLKEMKETKELLKKQFSLVKHERDLENERKRWMEEIERERFMETNDYKKEISKKIKRMQKGANVKN